MLGRSRVKVLLVEDVAPLLDLERTFLARHEVEILAAPDAASAIALAGRERPAVAVVDVRADGAAGLELCRRFKSEPPTRRMAVIALADPPQARPATEAGADALVPKPIVREAFLDAVRRFVSLTERRVPRVPVNLRFTFTIAGTVAQAFSREVSARGAFLKCDRDVAVGSRLRVAFRIPGDDAVVASDAVVRRAADPAPGAGRGTVGFGLEFEGMAEADAARLERFLERAASASPRPARSRR